MSLRTLICSGLLCWTTLSSLAAQPSAVQVLLQHAILASNAPMSEVQSFTDSRIPLMPPVRNLAEWEQQARQLRQSVFDQVIFRGAAAGWREAKTGVEWLETIPGGPGYQLRKLRYEAVPGLWIPAILYEPLTLTGRVPVVLNVNGHERIGKSVPYKQIRCINQARRGMIALNTEWFGMGQLRAAGYQHPQMNQLDLCGTSGIAAFYLAMSRALDILLAHPNADASRLAVAGLSGGGWQTIFISSLDSRVTLANPVAGYSSFRTRVRFLNDLGDSEQTPSDLATVADYTHLTALRAPRPTLLTFNAKDNCCFVSDHALPPLLEAARPIFQLYNATNRLRTHINFEPGDHNFGLENREAFYKVLKDFFFAGTQFDPKEIPCDAEIKSDDVLRVELPAENQTFNSLARNLAKSLPHQSELPISNGAAEQWQKVHRARLHELVRAKTYTVAAERAGTAETNGIKAIYWRLRMDNTWTVPVVEMAPQEVSGTIMLVADQGRDSLASVVEDHLKSGRRVLAVDPFYFGESRISRKDYLFALLVAAVGERPLGIQASQVAATARWAQTAYPNVPVSLSAHGPRASLFSLVAAALEPSSIPNLQLHGSLGSLKEIIENEWGVDKQPELFCFGLLEAFDIQHLAALAAPSSLTFAKSSQRVQTELGGLTRWFRQRGGQLTLTQ